MADKNYYDRAHETLGDWANDPNMRPEDQEALAELIGETREQSVEDGVTAERAKDYARAAVKSASEEDEARRDSDWRQNPEGQ